MIEQTFGNLWTIRSVRLRSLLDLQFASIRLALKRQVAKSAPTGPVLDFGAGSSPYQDLFPQCSVETLDSMVPAKYRSLDDLPAGKRYPLILGIEVLEHLPDPLQTLRSLAQYLEPDGKIWISVPFAARIHPAPEDYQRWTDAGLKVLFERAGLHTEHLEARGDGWSAQCSRTFFGLFQWARHPLGVVPAVLLGMVLVPVLLPLAHLSLRLGPRWSQEPLGFFAVVSRSTSGDHEIPGSQGKTGIDS